MLWRVTCRLLSVLVALGFVAPCAFFVRPFLFRFALCWPPTAVSALPFLHGWLCCVLRLALQLVWLLLISLRFAVCQALKLVSALVLDARAPLMFALGLCVPV